RALDLAAEVVNAADAPAIYALQAELIAIEAELALERVEPARARLTAVSTRIQPGNMSGTWGEVLRLRGRLHAAGGPAARADHDFGQGVSVFELLGERYQAGLSLLELGRLAATGGARSRATRHLSDAAAMFDSLGAAPDLAEARAAVARIPTAGTGGYIGVR